MDLEGTWQMIRAELAGEAAPELVTQKTEVELTAGAYVVRYAGEIVDRGSYAIAAAIETKTIVLRGMAGPNAGRTIPCIYQLKNDRLRICYGLDGIAPTEFTTNPGQQRYLAVYRRRTTSGDSTRV
jgi:uncharacterized protein (TIGR03067 family)